MTAAQVGVAVGMALLFIGIFLVGTGLLGKGDAKARAGRKDFPIRHSSIKFVVALSALVATWIVSGWPVLALGAGAAVLGLPAIVGADRRAQLQIDRAEAVEEWARRVADTLAIGFGLEQALLSAARSAPEPIAEPVANLASRIAARAPTERTLRQFADELADPSADLVVAALILSSRRRGPGVAAALTVLADGVSEDVAARRRIESDRAKPRATARAVSAISVFVICLGMANSAYTAPYGTALGQAVLAATLSFFGVALWWMNRMTLGAPRARLLRLSGGQS